MTDTPQSAPPENARPSSNLRRLVFPLLTGSIITLIAIGFYSGLLLPTLHGGPTPNTVKCGSNLRQIGQAIVLYANEHQGRYPDSMGDLLEQDISTAVFVCPGSNDESAAPGPTTRAGAANLHAGGHLSYIYLGKGLTGNPPATLVVAYEPLANHQNAGINVLHGDGHVEFCRAPRATAILAELNSGHNPPRDPIP